MISLYNYLFSRIIFLLCFFKKKCKTKVWFYYTLYKKIILLLDFLNWSPLAWQNHYFVVYFFYTLSYTTKIHFCWTRRVWKNSTMEFVVYYTLSLYFFCTPTIGVEVCFHYVLLGRVSWKLIMLIEVKNNVIGANSKPLVQVVPSLFVFLRWFCSKLSNMGHNLHTIHSYLLTPFNPIFSLFRLKLFFYFFLRTPFPPFPFILPPTLFSFPKPHTSFHVFLVSSLHLSSFFSSLHHTPPFMALPFF